MAWPDYQQLTARPVSFSRLAANIHLEQRMRITTLLLMLIIVYLVGTHLPLLSLLFARTHAIHIQQLQRIVAHSTLLTIVDQLFTGSSLSILSPFALGILPLLLFEINPKPTEARQAFRYMKEWSLSSIIFLAGLALVLFWLVVVGVIPNVLEAILFTALYLLAGSIALIVINQQLTRHKGPDIIAINTILIAYNYIRTLLHNRQLIDLAIVALIVLFVWSFVWLTTYTKPVQVTNIRNEIVREGELPLSASNSFMRFILLVLTFIVLVVVTTLLNVFVNNSLSPFGNSLPDVLLFIAILTMIALAFMSNEAIDSLLSQFNSASTAHTLMLSYWLVADYPVGEKTARFLRQEALKVHRWNYAFYLGWATLFSLMGLFAQLLRLPLTPLPFGPLGFLILLTLCSELCYAVFVALYSFMQSIRFGELWTPPTSTLSNLQDFLETDNLDDSLQDLLQRVPQELQNKLQEIRVSFKKGQPRIADFRELFQIWNQIRKEKQQQQAEVVISDLLLTFGKYILFGIVASVVTLFVVHFFLKVAFSDLPTLVGIITTAFFSFQAFFFDTPTRAFFSTLLHHPRQITFFRKTPIVMDNEIGTNLLYDALFNQQREVIQEKRNSLLNESHATIVKMIQDVPKLLDNDDTIQYYEDLCKRFDVWIQAWKALSPDVKLHYPYYPFSPSFPLILASRDALEQDVALHFINTLWGQYITQQLAKRDSLSNRLGVEEQDFHQFGQEAEADFEQLQRNIQKHTVASLLTIMQQCLTTPIALPVSPSGMPQLTQQNNLETEEQDGQASSISQTEPAKDSSE